jgi:hypothetical protein
MTRANIIFSSFRRHERSVRGLQAKSLFPLS